MKSPFNSYEIHCPHHPFLLKPAQTKLRVILICNSTLYDIQLGCKLQKMCSSTCIACLYAHLSLDERAKLHCLAKKPQYFVGPPLTWITGCIHCGFVYATQCFCNVATLMSCQELVLTIGKSDCSIKSFPSHRKDSQ